MINYVMTKKKFLNATNRVSYEYTLKLQFYFKPLVCLMYNF